MVTPAISTWLVSPGLRAAVARQPYWIQVIEAVILADLGFYVAHRLFHGVPWLWRFHAIHHSIQELDWLASVRVHVLSILDKLFGTMYMPEGQTPERYGLDEPVPHTYISQLLYPFKWARLMH